MKYLSQLFIPLLLASATITAADYTFENLQDLDQKDIAQAVFDNLKEQGEFGNADDETLEIANNVVQTIVTDPDLFAQFNSGDLNLEEYVTEYFLKDTVKKVVDTTKKVGTKIVDTTKKIGSSVFKTLKDVASGIASVANKTLTAITSSETIMKIIGVSVGIANKLIPYGANALGLALLAIPGAEPLIPVIAAAAPILKKVVTPTNVTKALEIAQSTASLADGFLNPKAASLAPSGLMAIEKKAKKDGKKSDREVAGEAIELALKGARAVEEYVQKMKPSEWDKLPKSTKDKLLNAINKVNKASALVDTNKLN